MQFVTYRLTCDRGVVGILLSREMLAARGLLYSFSTMQMHKSGRGGVVVRAHTSRAEGLRFESDSMP